MTRRTAPTVLLATGVSVLALGLAACSSTDPGAANGDRSTGSAPSGSASAASGQVSAGPVTIDHAFGSTKVATRPERIVSIDNQWTDVLVALEAPLVGAALDPMAEGGRYPWQDDVPASVEGFEVRDRSIPYEAVAELDPDLIVVSWAADQAAYDTLSQIAPTIPLLGDEEVDAWQDIAVVAGQVLGEPAAAQALVDDNEQMVADLKAELPNLDGRTYALANYVAGDAIYVVADPEDGASQFFAQLGTVIEPDLVALAAGAAGRAQLSLENVDELDADVLILLTNGADPAEIPGYGTLPAVAAGSVALVDFAVAVGLNTPTPLSLPYSIEAIRPALEAANRS